MPEKRSSGLDFADRWPSNTVTVNTFEQHPDVKDQDNGSNHLQQNFSERKRLQELQQTVDTFEQHPDLVKNQDNGSNHLQRNFSERKRMQGLQRSLTKVSSKVVPRTQRTFNEKFNIWLINEGPRQIFFGSWIFLHLLVIVFGFLFYVLSDNLEDARATFGITYCAPFYIYLHWPFNNTHTWFLLFPQLLLDQQPLFFMSMSPLSCCQSVVTLSLFFDGRL